MFHLLNQVYVDSDLRVDRTVDQINISKSLGFEFILTSAEMPGKQLGYATSLDEVDNKQLETWLDTANRSDGKVIIYADGDAYCRLYTMLVRAVFPGLTFEQFKWIMLCKKATFNSIIVAAGEPAMDMSKAVVITSKYCKELFDRQETLQPVMDELVAENGEEISMEWHIARLLTTGKIGNVPMLTKNLLRRSALSSALDAMDVWSRVLTCPEYWEMAGADADTLMGAESVFEGCLGLPHLSSAQLMRPGLFRFRPNDTWLKGMLTEVIMLLGKLQEESSSKRAAKLLELMSDDSDMTNPENCLRRVREMFHGEVRLSFPMRDTGKYDENLIRHMLSDDPESIKAALKGAAW